MCFRPVQVQTPIKCPECGAMNPFNRDTCKKCKAELPKNAVPMVKCPECGTESLPDSEFCTECGLTGEEWKKVVMDQIGDLIASGALEVAPGVNIPGAPAAPKAPTAPTAPGMPKAPTGPSIPSAPTGPRS